MPGADARSRWILAALAFAAWAPALGAGFVSDDLRFVVDNPPVRELTAANAVRYFTDPATQATVGHDIYRPLRTLDFAIDWKLSGGRPWLFHLRNLLYHVLGCLLLLALFRRLLPDDSGRSAFFAAAIFALHPVQAESVAFVSSRGDLIALCGFAAALLFHVRGRRVAAALLLVPAVLGKEIAVVFPVAAILVDLLRGERRAWGAYAAYAGVAGLYCLLWLRLMAGAGHEGFAQMGHWLGGSFGANLFVVGKALVHYVRLLLFPVNLSFMEYLPARRTVDAGAIGALVLLAGVVAAAAAGGRRSRFAAAWFLLCILPVSGLLLKVMTPSAERYLLLPSIGVCLWAGAAFPRTGLRWVVLGCLFALTFARCLDWRDADTLLDASLRAGASPASTWGDAIRQADRAEAGGDRAAAALAVRRAEEFFRLYRDDIHLTPEPPSGDPAVPQVLGAGVLAAKARALVVLGRPDEALAAAEKAIALADGPEARAARSRALEALGRFVDAAEDQAAALAAAAPDDPGRDRLAGLLVRAAKAEEAAGRRWRALELFRFAWDARPDAAANPEAAAGIRRLESR